MHIMGAKTSHCGCCFFVPPRVLQEYSHHPDMDAATQTKLQETYLETDRLRIFREAARVALVTHQYSAPALTLAAPTPPEQQIFDCRHQQSLPGRIINDPANSADAAAKTVFQVTAKVAEFYETVVGRNSVDNKGLDLVSSIHYMVNFDNAFWNGQQMVYGDGDNQLFIEFYNSPDVIGHELTHGVTQYESGLRYEGESGALNESISDAFGAVFNQWLGNKPASDPAGWLIGAGIMGPRATAAGKTCLRDMVDPAAAHCLSQQPTSYANFDPTADVHINSGIPNKAFASFAQAVGGNAWDQAIKLWYATCTGSLSSTATFADFANATVSTAQRLGGADLQAKVRQAWQAVEVPLAGA
jgi:Zn-dependent metalloprotease